MISPASDGGETVAQANVTGFQSTYWSARRNVYLAASLKRTSMHTTPSQEPRTEDKLDLRTRDRLDGGFISRRCQRPRNNSKTTPRDPYSSSK
jgi:hypothetical protein